MTRKIKVQGNRSRPRKKAEEPESRYAQKRREKIIAAANRLFREKGFLGTNVQDIADAARINKSTIYAYFKDKSYLLYISASKDMHTLIELANSILSSAMPPEEKLKALLSEHIKWRAANFGLQLGRIDRRNLPPKLLLSYIKLRDDYEALFRSVIGENMAQGKEQYLNPKIASLFILGLANSINQWFRIGGELSADELAELACSFIFKAMEINTLR